MGPLVAENAAVIVFLFEIQIVIVLLLPALLLLLVIVLLVATSVAHWPLEHFRLTAGRFRMHSTRPSLRPKMIAAAVATAAAAAAGCLGSVCAATTAPLDSPDRMAGAAAVACSGGRLAPPWRP